MLTRAQRRVQDSLNRVRDGVERLGSSSDGQAAQSGNGTQDRTSSPSVDRPPSVININDSSSQQDQRSTISSASQFSHQSYINNSRSTESHASPISHPSQFSRAFRKELIDDYTSRFQGIYDYPSTSREVFRLADLLKTVYHSTYQHGADAVDVRMHDVYVQYCDDMDGRLNSQLVDGVDHRLRGGADAASNGNDQDDDSTVAVAEAQVEAKQEKDLTRARAGDFRG